MDTDTVAPASSVRYPIIPLRIRVPVECPWNDDQIRAALTGNDLFLDPTTDIQQYTNGGVRLTLRDKEVILPPSLGKFVVADAHPFISIPEWVEVMRRLSGKGLRLALVRTEVTVPYSFFSISI